MTVYFVIVLYVHEDLIPFSNHRIIQLKKFTSLYTLVNIIQSLYDGNTFVCVTIPYDSILSSHERFRGHTGHVIKNIIRYYLCKNSRNGGKFDSVYHEK